MTAALSMFLGWEPLAFRRIIGVLTSFAGCATMVVLSAQDDTGHTIQDGNQDGDPTTDIAFSRTIRLLVGHMLFFCNCLCTALYVLLSKKPLQLFSPLKVTAWSYNIAAVFMVITAYLTSLSPSTIDFLCPDCVGTWEIPTGAVWALVYAVVFNSVLAYFLIMWANQYATGTLVIGYSTIQPVAVATLTALLLGMGMYPSCKDVVMNSLYNSTDPTNMNINDAASAYRCLEPPGWGTMLGMVGVFGGLFLVIITEPHYKSSATTEMLEYNKVTHNDCVNNRVEGS